MDPADHVKDSEKVEEFEILRIKIENVNSDVSEEVGGDVDDGMVRRVKIEPGSIECMEFKEDSQIAMAARGHYRRVSDVDRDRLIDAFENNMLDYLELADNLGITRATARSIVSIYLRTGRRERLPKGGAHNAKMDNDMRQCLQHLLDVNPLLTLTQMKKNLQAALPNKPHVSTSTIARSIDGMLLTLKLTEDVPDARNSPRVLDQRMQYAQWFLQHGVVAHCVFIDETGYNVWTRRSFGRAPRGLPARRVVHGQRGRNCNITFAVCAEVGLVHYQIAFETVTRQSFEGFLANTARECANVFPAGEPVFLIYDNARPHVQAQLPPDAYPNIQLKLLPPYSPFLNCTEIAHSAFKASVKRDLALPEWQHRVGDRDAAHQAGLNLQQWRCQLLQEVARQNFDAITQEKCARWFKHTQTYMHSCLAHHDIDG
uniref:Tc1-like transposase DDE domain-containing protein n=1 Tax=Eptatretus burgeri TaxID=7764 RepID=A0A8C4NGT2_EPTBU